MNKSILSVALFLVLRLVVPDATDHKFDPFTSEDYYALAGVLASTQLQDQSLRSEQTPVLEIQLNQLLAQQVELRKTVGLRMGTDAIEHARQYLAEVPEVLSWQQAELGTQIRLLLSETAKPTVASSWRVGEF